MDWLALVSPFLIWAKAAWLSPYLRTHRHRLSGILSVIAGGLMFASLRLDAPAFPVLFVAVAMALAAMFVALFWPPGTSRDNRPVP